MTARSTTIVVEFKHGFVVPGANEQFPPGLYEVLIEEELLEGLSFAAYRETGAYLMIYGKGHNSGPTEMRPISSAYLNMALKRDALFDASAESCGSVPPSEMARAGEGGSPLQDRQAQHLKSPETVTGGNRIKRWIETVMSPLPR